jgi:glycosyltransferase involved in cell wall biosynthesis
MYELIKKTSPKVLACFCVYNEESKILQAISQMQKQTYTNLEIAVFDNCSTDGTKELIDMIKQQNFIVFKSSKNKGYWSNFVRMHEYVVSRKDCEYFLYADVDDLYHEDYITELVAILERQPMAVGGVPSFIMNHTTLEEVVFFGQHCSYEILSQNISRFSKAFKIINDTSLQFCMIWRSLLRRSFVETISTNQLFIGVEEFLPVLALYLGGIVTISQELHVKYQVQAPLSDRKIDIDPTVFSMPSFSKKWRVFIFDAIYTFNLKKLSLYEKMQIIFLLFYRVFMKYKLVNTVQLIKSSKNPIARLIIIMYQPVKKIKRLLVGG